MKHANVAVFVPNLGCPHRCSFCDQHVISGQQKAPTTEDIRRVAREGLRNLGKRAELAEFAFFGGSFTALPRPVMTALLEAARPFVSPDGRPGFYRGVRLSTRPDALDAETLRLLRGYGVTAVELGAQSMDDGVLRQNGRGHTAADIVRAAGLIRAAGLELGVQMMTGLYGDTDAGALRTARALCALRPDTVRIYPTLVVRGTELARLFRAGAYCPQTLESAVSLGARLLGLFERAGVRVIRMGLHAGPGLEESVLAGPFHPAFRELCQGERFYRRACRLLENAGVPIAAGADVPQIPVAPAHGPVLPPRGERASDRAALRPADATGLPAAHPPHRDPDGWLLGVAPQSVSKMAGQRRRNLLRLSAALGAPVRVRALPGLSPEKIRLLRRPDGAQS